MRRLVLFLFIVSLSFSAIAVNSFDGRDVVSAVYYGAVMEEKVVFVSPSYNQDIVYGKIGTGGDVLLVQSLENAIIPSMENDLENMENEVEVMLSENPYETNLELAERSGASKFILVDPVYGYNTVSALAYAKLNSMYLVFAESENSESVMGFLKGKNPEEILVYGYLDSEVKNALDGSGLSYEEINNGDKFEDNLEILELYFEENPSKKQAILSDGNAFEDTIVAADDPVILISPIVPATTYEYIEGKAVNGELDVAMVVDQEYAQTAYDLKESINSRADSEVLHVLVKFGQSIGGSEMADVELFPLPGPILGLEITDAGYNTVSEELEITYENTGNAPEYVKSRIMVFADGDYVATVGENEPFMLDKNEKLGKGYSVDVEEGEITANITSFYSSSKKYEENGIQLMAEAGRVDFEDLSVLEISDFTLDESTGDLVVTFENTGNITVYFRADATLEINNKTTRIKEDEIYELASGEGRMVRFPGIIKSGAEVTAGADYGAREAFLENRIEKNSRTAEEFDMNILYLGVIIILAAVVGYLLFSRKK